MSDRPVQIGDYVKRDNGGPALVTAVDGTGVRVALASGIHHWPHGSYTRVTSEPQWKVGMLCRHKETGEVVFRLASGNPTTLYWEAVVVVADPRPRFSRWKVGMTTSMIEANMLPAPTSAAEPEQDILTEVLAEAENWNLGVRLERKLNDG